MFLKKYIMRKIEEKKALEEQEKLFLEIVEKEEKRSLMEMDESKNNQHSEDDKPHIELKRLEGREYYEEIMGKIRMFQRRQKRIRMTAALSSAAIITCFAATYVTRANPFNFLIQVVEFMDGKMSANPDSTKQEKQNTEELEFEIYQVSYMTEDYVLMTEETLDSLYKMRYYKNSENFIYINQSPLIDEKTFSLTDETEYQTLLKDGIEYYYNYDTDMATSTLYFIKDNTSITINGTIQKEEILQIANGLYKKYE